MRGTSPALLADCCRLGSCLAWQPGRGLPVPGVRPLGLTPKQVRYQTALCPESRSPRGFPVRLRIRAGMIRGVLVPVNFRASSWSLKLAVRQCRRTQVQRLHHASPDY
jgi:hypothetical protein